MKNRSENKINTSLALHIPRIIEIVNKMGLSEKKASLIFIFEKELIRKVKPMKTREIAKSVKEKKIRVSFISNTFKESN